MKRFTTAILTVICFLFSNAAAARTGDEQLKEKALLVLQTKCNVCHIRNNPFKVFNARNMERHANAINTQVFVKGRMPKGDEIKLSTEEREILKAWLAARN
ncbi:MAG TPA: hypothetical protein VM802_16105 [Chitinophaga sp.]|uniref:hypothetical protein n=1 Tax=Chitinophaga sp. TaxID=1869181 RepID=UPI002B7877C6|nr:hypothetical protein [Chitinophaga sp.]HVI46399.1 hypothetical protein [Chitinophaga sp.]